VSHSPSAVAELVNFGGRQPYLWNGWS